MSLEQHRARIILESYKTDIQKSEFTQGQLRELVGEHENLIKVLESPSKSDDKEEATKQKKELEGYKDQMTKSEALEILGL